MCDKIFYFLFNSLTFFLNPIFTLAFLQKYMKTFIIFGSKYIIKSNLFNYVFRYVANTNVPIPTHYFVVLTSCKNKSHTPDACPGWLDVLSFIIPHRPTNVESCPVSVLWECPQDREQLGWGRVSFHKCVPTAV